jgi:hypothetical protein
MLLIVVLGLIAKLALVSSDCDIGTQTLNDFDWNKVRVELYIYIGPVIFIGLNCSFSYVSFVVLLTTRCALE